MGGAFKTLVSEVKEVIVPPYKRASNAKNILKVKLRKS
jgi:hypothetical protein